MRGLGLLTLVIAFPAVAIWVREPRPGEGEHRAGAQAGLPGLSAREALGSSRFWILLTVFFLVAITVNGAAAHVGAAQKQLLGIP